MIKTIVDNNVTYAKIIRSDIPKDGNTFFTEPDDEIQFGVLNYKKNYKTGAHYHGHIKSKKNRVDEILMFQSGSARIDFYSEVGAYIVSSVVNAGDIVIIYLGGHNVVYLEDTRIFMLKPGAYDSASDKTRIIGTNNTELVIEN